MADPSPAADNDKSSDFLSPPRPTTRRSGRFWLWLILIPVVAMASCVAAVIVVGPEDNTSTVIGPGTVDLDYRCEQTGGLMLVNGSMTNRTDQPLKVRLVLSATSDGPFDPPIERSYTITLAPQEKQDLRMPVISAESIGKFEVDDDYRCSAVVVAP